METVIGPQAIMYKGRVLPPIAGGAPTLDELRSRNDEIRERLQDIDRNGQGRTLTDDERDEWNTISEELERNTKTIDEMEQRVEWLARVAQQQANREQGAHFGVASARGQSAREDIFDLTTVRSGFSHPEDMVREAQDRAKRAISEHFTFPHPDVRSGLVPEARVRQHMLNILESAEREDGALSLYMLRAGSPVYARAFGKVVMGQALTTEEQRALGVATGSAGGYAVPITLDPTLIPVSNGVVNPMRAISRVETIVGLEYRGLTTQAVVASYAAEGTEASDNSPTLSQPDVQVERAQAFVPYSIEIGMDWAGLQAGMAKLIADSKDVLEGQKFTLGAGHSSAEPSGVLTGATSTIATASSGAFALADLYALEQSLPPRFRPLGQWLGNRATYNRVRQFDQYGGAALWQPIFSPESGPLGIGLDNRPIGNMGQRLLGYAANEVSDFPAVVTAGTNILALGDPNYYLIVDRVGMTIETIPHLFGASRRPTGQRGLYAYWRNTGAVVDPNAWRVLHT